MKLIRLSLKNMARYRTRSIITILAVMISVSISVVVDGFLRGVFDLSTYNLIRYESAEATVYADGYFEKRNELPSVNLIEREKRDAVSSSLDSASVFSAPRYKTGATLIHYSEEAGIEMELTCTLVAVDAERDASVFSVASCVDRGKWLEKGKDGIVVGSRIAEKLGVTTGDVITLELSGRDGFREVLDEEITGIVNTENPAVNKGEVFMDLDVADEYLLLDGAVSEIAVSDGRTAVASVRFPDRVNSIIGEDGVHAYYYEDINSDLMAIMNGDKGSSVAMLVFLFIIAAAGISNTMIMAAMERTKESAMMRAMGFSRSFVTLQFVMEGFLSGVIGSLTGCIAAFFILYPLCRYGIDISGLVSENVDFGYRIPLLLKAGLFPQSFIIIPFLALIFSALSAFFPVRHYGKKEIAELFRRA